jgi:hypothetical protein
MIQDALSLSKLCTRTLESTIEKSVWDKLTSKQKDAFVPITNETRYPTGYFPLYEKAKSDPDN